MESVFPQSKNKKLLITGSSGLVGTALRQNLKNSDFEILTWNRKAGPEQADLFSSVDAVINLAGESIAEGRWTEAKKRRLIESREIGRAHV